MTIVNLRGTSGSGKSTVIRKVMETYPQKVGVKKKGRERPIGYICTWPKIPEGRRPLFVVGHYETDCGGCDTITNVQEVYDMVVQASQDYGYDVLYEGLLISAEYRRTHAMSIDPNLDHYTVGLDVPLEVCLASINARRAGNHARRLAATEAYNASREATAVAAGRKPPKPRPLPEPRGEVAETNTKSKWKATRSTMQKLMDNGARAEWHDRDSAVVRIRELLGW